MLLLRLRSERLKIQRSGLIPLLLKRQWDQIITANGLGGFNGDLVRVTEARLVEPNLINNELV